MSKLANLLFEIRPNQLENGKKCWLTISRERVFAKITNNKVASAKYNDLMVLLKTYLLQCATKKPNQSYEHAHLCPQNI